MMLKIACLSHIRLVQAKSASLRTSNHTHLHFNSLHFTSSTTHFRSFILSPLRTLWIFTSASPMAPLLASRSLDIPRALFAHFTSEPIAEQIARSAKRAVLEAGPGIAKLSAQNLLLSRGLSVNSTQGTTLGVIAAYAVAIALLWNLPYVRWSLWPFKVSA
jgi:hypothetical protein